MIKVIKCTHCDYVNYLAEMPGRCPKCGGHMEEMENPFKGDSFKTKVMNYDMEKIEITVTFEQMCEKLNNMIVKDPIKITKDEFTQNRILMFLQVYIWMLLKRAPALWHHFDVVVSGLREILTLKVKGG